MIEATKDNFDQEVRNSSGLVMVDWWGPKCEHCLELMPHVEELEKRYGDRMKFCKVNTAGNRRLAIGEKVLGLPAMVFYRDGQRVAELSGQDLMPEDIEAKIKELID